MPTVAPKRADARRNIEAIVDAATALLAVDPDVSVNDIAKQAGVGRVTLYGHFETRAALVAEVSRRAIQQSESDLANLDLGGDPADALGRLLDASWHLTHRFGALVVAAEHTLGDDELRHAHDAPFARARNLLERGRDGGAFRADVPLEWQLTLIQAVLHAASAAVHRGEITADDAPHLVRDAALAALTSAA